MTGRYRVTLRKLRRTCPFCGSPARVYTAPVVGTLWEPSCTKYTCRHQRRLALAGNKPPSFEPQPVDDRRTVKHR